MNQDNVNYLKKIYIELLNRKIDKNGLREYLNLMEKKNYSKRDIARIIKNSEEYLINFSKTAIPKKMLQNQKLNDQEILEGKSILKSNPQIFNIDMIGICNMFPPCSMCLDWNDKKGPRHHKGLSTGDIKVFEDFIKSAHHVVNCSIGEPLVLKDFPKILKLFNDWEKPLGINSNGLALSSSLTDQLAPFFNFLSITFSLDAASSDTYRKIRNDRFEQVIQNISYYQKKREELNPQGYSSKTGLVMIPMKVNQHEVSDFVKLAAHLGVDRVELRGLNQIQRNHVVQRGDFTFDYHEQILSGEELEQIRIDAEKTAKKHKVVLECQYQVSEEETYGFFLPDKYKDTNLKCILPFHFILPYQNGDTSGCCYMSKSLGNWRKEGLDKLWNSTRMQKLRLEMLSGDLPEECHNYKSCPIVQKHLEEEFAESSSQDLNHLINKRDYHISTPNRFNLVGKLIKKMRYRMSVELEHLITPILDNQKEINKILLKEISSLKERIEDMEKKSNKS